MSSMKAILLTGHGSYDQLVYSDVPIPELGDKDVLIKVLASSVNNTDVNTRLGWYSSSVTSDTASMASSSSPSQIKGGGGWQSSTPFPLIQGTDCCGVVVQCGSALDTATVSRLMDKRVLVRPCQRAPNSPDRFNTVWMASDFNGAFAEYVRVRATEAFPIESSLADTELGTFPCAYGTAENMLHRAKLGSGEVVVIVGASGGVGSACIQLSKRRGAVVVAITSEDKVAIIRELGADIVLTREVDLLSKLGDNYADLVCDNVGGKGFGTMVKLLKRGGRYVTSGAIGGPIVSLDMRDLYLKDIMLIGSTCWDEDVFPNLIRYIERGEVKPLVSAVFPLSQIAEAQKVFLSKLHVGKIALVPDSIHKI